MRRQQEQALLEPFGAFCNPEVVVTTAEEVRVSVIRDLSCWAEQSEYGPTVIVIRPSASDVQLSKIAERYRLAFDDLKAFRASLPKQ